MATIAAELWVVAGAMTLLYSSAAFRTTFRPITPLAPFAVHYNRRHYKLQIEKVDVKCYQTIYSLIAFTVICISTKGRQFHISRHTDRQTHGQTDTRADRVTDRQTETQTDTAKTRAVRDRIRPTRKITVWIRSPYTDTESGSALWTRITSKIYRGLPCLRIHLW